MRVNLFAVLIPLITACGGGGSDPPVVIVDMAPPIDQPPAAACPICGPMSTCTVQGASAQSLGGLIFIKDAGPDGMAGTADDTPVGLSECGGMPCDFFQLPASGANMGKNSFVLIAGIPNDIDGDGTNDLNTGDPSSELVLGIEIVSMNGAFIAGTTNFSTNPAAITSAQIFAMPMGTQGYDAISYLLNVSGTSINSVYISTSGSITTTEINDAQNQRTNGTVALTNYAETDGMTTGTCTTSLEGLDFKLIQGTATFQSSGTNTASVSADPRGRLTGISRTRAEAIYSNLQTFLKRK